MVDPEKEYDKLYRYCYYRVHSRELAEDLTQEAFTRFWERGGKEHVGYLYTIARNLCIDESRKKVPVPLPEDTAVPGPEEQTLERVGVRKALASLPEEERELLLLRYDSGLTVGDIGRMLDLSRFAVYRRLSGAANQLEKNLKKEGIL